MIRSGVTTRQVHFLTLTNEIFRPGVGKLGSYAHFLMAHELIVFITLNGLEKISIL